MLSELKKAIILASALLIVAIAVGCEDEEEEYQIETDLEFQEEVEDSVEEVFRGMTTESAIIDNLNEKYSDRYEENDIEDYFTKRMDQEEEVIIERLDEIEERVDELEEQGLENLDELELVAEEETIREVEGRMDSILSELEELDQEAEATEDLYRLIELTEEMKAQYKEMIDITEEALQEAGQDKREIGDLGEELQSYYQQIKPLGEKEQDIIVSLNNVTGENYTSDQDFYNELESFILPETRSLLEELRGMEPGNEELSQLHSKFVEGWETQQEGFQLYLEGLEEGEEEIVLEGDRIVEEGGQLLQSFNHELNQMAGEHGVELE